MQNSSKAYIQDPHYSTCSKLIASFKFILNLSNTMSIPETPSETGYFPAQHGYKDVKVKTHQYKDKPTPFAAKQGKASEFISSHTDKEHQKQYAKKIGRRLFDILIRQVCK